MKTFCLFLCGVVLLGAGRRAGAAPSAVAPQGNRYLLVVETSKWMKPVLPAVQQCVQTLLAEQMSGQLQRGDTLGIWTYNDQLHAGDFPMQVWTAESAAALAQRVDVFLGKQKAGGAGRLQSVVESLAPVIADSERLTILIFSDGTELIAGTPFDAVINRVFTQHRAELRTASVPFLTVLQAVGGKIIHCTVNAASGPIKIPELPKPPVVATPPKPAPPAVVVMVNTNAPLIVNHSKPATNVAPVVAPVVPTPPATSTVAVTSPIVPAVLPTPTTSTAVAVVITPPVATPVSTPPRPAVPPPSNVVTRQPEPITSTNVIPPAPATPPPAAAPMPGWVWLVMAVAVGAGLVVWLGRHQRMKAHTSAITESLDRRKR